ncbi:MAG: transcription elongation factor GreA [Candidatus Portnoybacteria bacterium CG23_combo_of_CG06-09_8_20_14_all_37_13]|uniref:Transcription elongation factor GreA n=1 Tax=Candidatus Portnoybacteria bacterium CG23_combo_of_CG06-09_8_20_14_all_37_13 TaxID=1974819 RepID=A0A2G9YF66_9BACT|nr:MAG: transcription elongation factor GreA [Candidatus Portnoybacteria bacterium CG23_combo_of_CG06-09_8_20_14_all_37_13]
MNLTKENLEKLQKKLDFLKKPKRREISLRIQSAKELGDLSENAEYNEAKEAQSLNEAAIAELEKQIREATIIEESKSNKIQISSNVKVQSVKGVQQFTIVSSNESNPLEGKISDESPLGKILINHCAGDKVELELPDQKVNYKILEVR